jgi:hypothetical protein
MSKKNIFQLYISLIFVVSMLFGGLYTLQLKVGSQILIETKSNVSVANDTRLDNNEAIVRDLIVGISSSSTSSSYNYVGFDADALSFIKKKASSSNGSTDQSVPVEQKIVLFGYQINITNNNYNTNNNTNSAQAQASNNNSINTDAVANSIDTNIPTVIINNPVELVSFVASNPHQAGAMSASMIRTGGGYNLLILPLLLILLIVGIKSFYSKNFKLKIK